MGEGINFLIFITTSLLFHNIGERMERNRAAKNTHWAGMKRKHRRHVVVGAIAVVFSHPPVWHGIQEYTIHVIVYSGIVFPSH